MAQQLHTTQAALDAGYSCDDCTLVQVVTHESKITFSVPALGSVIVLLYAIHPWVVGASSMVMSEAIYTCMTFITILLIWRYERKDRAIALSAIFVAVMLVFTSLVRTVGITLTIAAFLYLGIVQRKPRHLMTLVAAWIVAYLPVFLFNRNGGGGVLSPGYMNQTVGTPPGMLKVQQMATNLWSYFSDFFPSLILPLPHSSLAIQIGIASVILILLLVGTRRLSRQGWLLIVYLGVYALGVLSFWNPSTGNAQTRFLLPVVPFVLLLVVAGLDIVQQWLLKILPSAPRFNYWSASRYAIALAVFGVGATYLGRDAQAILRPAYQSMTDLSIGTSYLAQNSSSDVIVACQDPVSMYLYANRKTMYYPGDSIESFNEGILKSDVDYVIVAPRLAPYRSRQLDTKAQDVALPAIQARTDIYRLVFRDSVNNVSVFETVKTNR